MGSCKKVLEWRICISATESFFDGFLYPSGDLNHSQNLMGSKLDLYRTSQFFHEDLTSIICVILLTNRQINGLEFNTSLVGGNTGNSSLEACLLTSRTISPLVLVWTLLLYNSLLNKSVS